MIVRPLTVTTFALIILSGCGAGEAQSPKNRFRLYVSLFSSIPDAADDQFLSLKKRVKTEFEAKNPKVELMIKDLDSANDDAYTVKNEKPTQIGTWLTAPVGGDDPNKSGLQLVEADMVVLGELVKQDLVKPWAAAPQTADWHPAARDAVTLDGKVYGVPHWLCGDVIFSHNKDIVKARTAKELRAALDKGTTPTHLAGRMAGSWNFASLYLDAYADTYGADHVMDGLKDDLDVRAETALATVAHACSTAPGVTPCLDKTYSDPTVAPYLFAENKADAVLGYSERLHFILKHAANSEKVYFESAPLGDGNHPLLFVDAFVLRKDCTATCETSAKAFAEYMAAPETMSWMLMSEDADASRRVPRYLLPATKSAFDATSVKNDLYYPKMKSIIADGKPYPSTKFYDIRPVLLNKLTDAIKP